MDADLARREAKALAATLEVMTKAAEAAAEALHQHGPTRSEADAARHGPTPRWQDCPRAETHRGAGRDVAAAVLDAVGHYALRAERDVARELIRHLDDCVKRGGPSNYRRFLPEHLQSVASAALDRGTP